jgi:hypothetical protein
MTRRLPRLPRDTAIIERAGFPALKLQQWWQSVVEAIEQGSAQRSVDATGDIRASDRHLFVDATAGAVTLTLPVASDNDGMTVLVKKIDASVNAVTIAAQGADTIDGAATQALAAQYDALTLFCDGSGWWLI